MLLTTAWIFSSSGFPILISRVPRMALQAKSQIMKRVVLTRPISRAIRCKEVVPVHSSKWALTGPSSSHLKPQENRKLPLLDSHKMRRFLAHLKPSQQLLMLLCPRQALLTSWWTLSSNRRVFTHSSSPSNYRHLRRISCQRVTKVKILTIKEACKVTMLHISRRGVVMTWTTRVAVTALQSIPAAMTFRSPTSASSRSQGDSLERRDVTWRE